MAFASPRLGARITVTGAEAPTYQPPKAWMPSPRSGVGSPRMQLAPPASDSVDAPGRTWLSQKTVTNAMASGPSNYLRSRAVFNGVHNGVKMLSPREKSGAAGGQIVPPHQTDSKGAPMRGVTSFPYDPSQTAYIENFAPIVASTLVHPYNAITESNADSIAFNIITGSAFAPTTKHASEYKREYASSPRGPKTKFPGLRSEEMITVGQYTPVLRTYT